MRVEESLNVKFDESPTPKSPPLVDDDILENDIIENQDKNLKIKENEPLNKEITNIKHSKDHPLETVIGSLNERTQNLKFKIKATSFVSFPPNLLLTPKSTPPPLTSLPSAPTQPSKLKSPSAINLDPIELLFSTPPTSPQAFLESLEELLTLTTNPLPPRPSFDTIERMANDPPPIPPIESTFPSPTPDMEPPLPPLPPHLLLNLPLINPPLLPLGPNNPFLILTHEMFCEHCQRTQAIIDNIQEEMRFILNHILDRLNVLSLNF
ncbi:hypothetical protein Tco_0861839 [Tanacetum coccineum]